MSPPLDKRCRPEILAPAGDPLCLRAAIAAGADAVYLGMARFNARGRAERFRGVTFRNCVRAAHDHGVRVYVTLNTLLHEDELPVAIDLGKEALDAGVDAAIIQDLGLAVCLRESVSDLKLHGSTQMTIHQPEQAEEAVKSLGLRRIIAARECSVDEIGRIVERIRPLGASVEVFVHGALCFAYSGQCLMSNFAGRRSANRGICAQNCRFDFSRGPGRSSIAELRSEPGSVPHFDRRSATQLISPKDLAAFESVGALADRGVSAFKIEGRLKGPDYVAEVVRLYRAALDAWEERRPLAVEDAERAAGRVYSRGFTNGYLLGKVSASMRGDKRSLEGEPDATVVQANRKDGVLRLEVRSGHRVLPGQGYRYAHDRYRGGFRVLAVEPEPDGSVTARVRFGAEASGRSHRRGATGRRRPPPPLPRGAPCFLNDDPELDRRIEELVRGVTIPAEPEAVGLWITLSGQPREPLRLAGRTDDGRESEVSSRALLEPSTSRPLGPEWLSRQLGRLGGTPYRLAELDTSALVGDTFLPVSEINALRRELVERLDALGALGALGGTARPHGERRTEPSAAARETRLLVCVGSPDAARRALEAGADLLGIDDPSLVAEDSQWEERWGPGSAELGDLAGPLDENRVLPRLWIRLSPIAHDDRSDRVTLDRVCRLLGGAGVIAGHLGQLALARSAGVQTLADVFLNVYNHESAHVLHELGSAGAFLSLELDAREAVAVASRTSLDAKLGVVIGGAVTSMLTRQPFDLERKECFLALSEHGHAYRFETLPDATTILWEARELVGAQALGELVGRVDLVRLDLAHLAAEAVFDIAGAYRAAIDSVAADPGSLRAGAIERARETHARHARWGTFPGHLLRGARTLDSD